MTVQELINKLMDIKDKDSVIVYTDYEGGWTNIDLLVECSVRNMCDIISIVPSSNREK